MPTASRSALSVSTALLALGLAASARAGDIRLASQPSPPSASCSFSAGWHEQSRAVHYGLEPPVVDPRVPEAVALKVKTGDPSVDRVVVALAAGETLPLSPAGADLYCILLTPRQVLFGYGPEKMEHNFVGSVDFYRGGAQLSRRSLFANVADDAVPDVPLERIAEDMQAGPHALNLFLPGVLPADLD